MQKDWCDMLVNDARAEVDTDVRDRLGTRLLGEGIVASARAAVAVHYGMSAAVDAEQGGSASADSLLALMRGEVAE